MKNDNRNTRTTWLRRNLTAEAGYNISWSSVIAGVVTFFATLALLSLIGNAIGFGILDPTSSTPFEGVGTGVIIWTVIQMILAFAAAGFVAGLAARRVGVLHGFLTWATSLVLIIIMLTSGLMSAVSGVSSLIGNSFSLLGDGASTVGSGLGDLVGDGINSAGENLKDIDTKELEANINDVLRDTDVKELQPEYIQNQTKEAQDEITKAGKDILLKPEDADKIITNLTDSLKKRAETIANAADKDAISKAVSKNTELSEAESKKAVDNIYNGLQEASKEANKQLNAAADQVEESKQDIQQAVEDARKTAGEVSDTIAKTSIWTFIGLAVAMVLTIFTGAKGSQFALANNEERM